MLYAGFWWRVLAALIDGVIVNIALWIITAPFTAAVPATGAEPNPGLGVLGLAVQWLYFTVLESSKWQATPGKRLVGIYVTDAYGGRIGWGKANARYWSKIISAIILFIGFIMVAFTEKKQGLHDLIASTLVFKGRTPASSPF